MVFENSTYVHDVCILVIHISHSPPYTLSRAPNTPPSQCHIVLIYLLIYLFILTHWIEIFCSYECELSTEVTLRILTESIVFFSLWRDDPTSKDACCRAVNLGCGGLTWWRERTDSDLFSSHFHTSTMARACLQTLQFTRTQQMKTKLKTFKKRLFGRLKGNFDFKRYWCLAMNNSLISLRCQFLCRPRVLQCLWPLFSIIFWWSLY